MKTETTFSTDLSLNPDDLHDRSAILEWNRKAAQLLRDVPELRTMTGRLVMSNAIEWFKVAESATVKLVEKIGR